MDNTFVDENLIEQLLGGGKPKPKAAPVVEPEAAAAEPVAVIPPDAEHSPSPDSTVGGPAVEPAESLPAPIAVEPVATPDEPVEPATPAIAKDPEPTPAEPEPPAATAAPSALPSQEVATSAADTANPEPVIEAKPEPVTAEAKTSTDEKPMPGKVEPKPEQRAPSKPLQPPVQQKQQPRQPPADKVQTPAAEPVVAAPTVAANLKQSLELQAAGKTEEALALAEAQIARETTSVEAWWTKAHILFEQGQWRQAAAAYATASGLAPSETSLHHNHGLALERSGDWAEAEASFRKAASGPQTRWETDFALGVCTFVGENFEESADWFRKAIAAEPSYAASHFGLAGALERTGQQAAALQSLEKVIALDPRNVNAREAAVGLALALNDNTKSIALAADLAKTRPDSPAALKALATAKLTAGDYVSAADLCGRITRSTPNDFEAWYNLGFANQQINKLDDAHRAYEEALRLRPGSVDTAANLGRVLQQAGKTQQAFEAYELVQKAEPERPGVLWNLALLCEAEGQNDLAEQLLESLVDREPDWQDAPFRLGYLRFLRSEYPGAADAFELCLLKEEDWPDAAYNLGVTQQCMGRPDAAKLQFTRVVELDKSNAGAWRALAQLSIESGDASRALEYQEHLTALGVDSPELTFNLALLLQEANEPEAAAKCYIKALEKKPDFAEALLNLGHALKALGRENEARACWNKALKLKPELATA